MLTKQPKKLQRTDVHQPALAWIARANVRLVIILGRRGWVQASFTNKELRELVTDENLLAVVNPEDFKDSLTEASKQELSESRLKQRSKVLLEQMVKNWERRNTVSCPVIHFRFLASPIRVFPHPNDASRLGAVAIARNKLEGKPHHQQAVQLGEKYLEHIPSSLLVWSTGFTCLHPKTVQFPTGKDGALKNDSGCVVPSTVDREGRRVAGVFASGWARRGPHGVIASNIVDAREVAANVLKDLDRASCAAGGAGAQDSAPTNVSTPQAGPENRLDESKKIEESELPANECDDITMLLSSRGVHFVTFDDWLHIKDLERAKGQKEGKTAVKTATASEMLRIAKERLGAKTRVQAS